MPETSQNPFAPQQTGQPTTTFEIDNEGKATASLVLGIIGLIAWIIAIVGMCVSIPGLVLGIIGLKSSKRGFAIAGIILCIIVLILSLINSAFGVYLAFHK